MQKFSICLLFVFLQGKDSSEDKTESLTTNRNSITEEERWHTRASFNKNIHTLCLEFWEIMSLALSTTLTSKLLFWWMDSFSVFGLLIGHRYRQLNTSYFYLWVSNLFIIFLWHFEMNSNNIWVGDIMRISFHTFYTLSLFFILQYVALLAKQLMTYFLLRMIRVFER